MRVTLTFELPEEMHGLMLALRAPELLSALDSIDRDLRSHQKHGTSLDIDRLRDEAALAWEFS